MTRILPALTLAAAALTTAAAHPNFSGTWEFNPKKGENVGMMAGMKITESIQQRDATLEIKDHANFFGKESDSKALYDLTGKSTANESPMAGPSETVSRWEGEKLVTTWTSAGSATGGKVVRTETRSLSSDGKVMTVELVRAGRDPVVMVYDREQ